MVLVDTSLWVEHFRKTQSHLMALLEDGRVLTHPWVLGELLLGSPRRGHWFDELQKLPQIDSIPDRDLFEFIESHKVRGQGIGWVDSQLIASALNSSVKLWTIDKKLIRVAERLGVFYDSSRMA